MKKNNPRRKIVNWEELIKEIKMQNIPDLYFIFPELGIKNMRKSGSYYFFLCPFHKEKKASCVYFLTSGHFRCYGCHRQGSIIDYYMLRREVDFHQAVIELAKIFKIKIKWGYSSDSVEVVLSERISLSLSSLSGEDIPF